MPSPVMPRKLNISSNIYEKFQIKSVALAIVVCGNMDKALQGPAQGFWVQDCSAATENILLAANALGLGAVWTGLYPNENRSAEVAKVLKLPQAFIPLCTIVIGHPAESPQPKDITFRLEGKIFMCLWLGGDQRG